LVSVYAVYQFFSGIDLWRGRSLTVMEGFYRATGAYDFYLTLAGNQLIIFFLAIPLVFSARRAGFSKSRYWIGLAVVLILAGIVSTFGRSSWIALIVIGLLALFWKIKGHRILGLIMIGIIGLAVFFIAPKELQDRLVSTFEFSRNQDRVNLWKTSWLMIENKPLFGVGPGNFKAEFDNYRVTGIYDATGHAHNDYLNLAATSGIPALAAWLCIWLVWFYSAVRKVKSGLVSDSDRYLLLGCVLGIAAIMVAAVFQCYYTDLENNICWSLLTILGLQIILEKKRSVSEPAN
jgi:O-antigen ligase